MHREPFQRISAPGLGLGSGKPGTDACMYVCSTRGVCWAGGWEGPEVPLVRTALASSSPPPPPPTSEQADGRPGTDHGEPRWRAAAGAGAGAGPATRPG